MAITRALSKQISRALIGVVLLAQLLVSAYACPDLSMTVGAADTAGSIAAESDAGEPGSSVAIDMEMGPGCGEIDQDAANLCAEHCRYGQQRADTTPAPAFVAAPPSLLYLLPAAATAPLHSDATFLAFDPVLATPPPPHAILHCVYRI